MLATLVFNHVGSATSYRKTRFEFLTMRLAHFTPACLEWICKLLYIGHFPGSSNGELHYLFQPAMGRRSQ
jgi:hypothetical protein